MGRGRTSLVLPVELPENRGACTLVWNHGFELHVRIETPLEEYAPGDVHATVDLGEIQSFSDHDEYRSGHHRNWAWYPFPQKTTQPACGANCEKASPLQEVFAPVEEVATC